VFDRHPGSLRDAGAGHAQEPASIRFRRALTALAHSNAAWGILGFLALLVLARAVLRLSPDGPIHPVSKQLLIWSIGGTP
jgi:hypothetical protein